MMHVSDINALCWCCRFTTPGSEQTLSSLSQSAQAKRRVANSWQVQQVRSLTNTVGACFLPQSCLQKLSLSCRQVFLSVPRGQEAPCWGAPTYCRVWHHFHCAFPEEDGDRRPRTLWLHRPARWGFHTVKEQVAVCTGPDIHFGCSQSVPFCSSRQDFLLEGIEPCFSPTDSSC